MSVLKAIFIGLVLSCCIATVIGSQGSSGGPLGIQSLMVADYRVYWSFSLFLAGTGLSWGLMLLQR
ncbi:MAG: hypothetical protein ABJP70_03310 [Erythrobacter sp.]